MEKKTLFDDEEERETTVKLNVNDKFAKRFERNQARVELERLQKKYPEKAARLASKGLTALRRDDGGDGGSSTDEEEDDGLIPDKTEAQIFETLVKIRNKDPSVYDKNAKFYSSDEEDEEDGSGEERGGGGAKGKGKERPMYLKDVVYQQAMQRAERGEPSSDEEGSGGGGDDGARVKTYAEEQLELKAALLRSLEEDDGAEGGGAEFGGVLKRRRRGGEGGAAPAEAHRVQELLDDYFGGGEGQLLGQEDQFLRSYILNKGWVDAGDGDDSDGGGGPLAQDEEDEAALAAADAFEAQYNFRYEEPGGAEIVTYPRQIEGTVRKEGDRRKRAREARAAREEAAEEQRAAELRRLKNLKRREIEGRLAEVQGVAGAAGPAPELLDSLLEGDFDPEAHDRAMAAAFGDGYYQEGEDDEDIEDERFERQLAEMAEYGTEDEEAAAGTFKAVHAQMMAKAAARGGGAGEEEGDDDAAEDGEAAAARARAEVARLLEEYHRLDYEDHVGGVPCRFRYKEVEPEDYGLTAEELLTLDDRELNQIVGLKRVAAPYRADGGRVRPNYGKLNQLRRERREAEGGRGGGRGRGGGGWKPARDGGPSHYSAGRPKAGAAGGGGEGGKERPAPPTEAEQRLASYAKPTLKREKRGTRESLDDGPGAKKRKREQPDGQQQTQQADGPQLTKAQRKNLKRQEKRAAKRQAGETNGGGA